jgi:mRNA interferase RelE/StbE
MSQRYTVYLRKNAKKTLLKIPRGIVLKIGIIIDELQYNPLIGVKMNGRLSHLRKIKVVNYRIIYQIIEFELTIEVIEIESRGNVFYDR